MKVNCRKMEGEENVAVPAAVFRYDEKNVN